MTPADFCISHKIPNALVDDPTSSQCMSIDNSLGIDKPGGISKCLTYERFNTTMVAILFHIDDT